MSKTIRIVTLVEIEDYVDANDVADWINGHMDNIDYDMLDEMGIDQSNVSVGITFPEGFEL